MKRSIASRIKETLRRIADPLRCRYDDCPEGHPVPDDDNARITCPTCREWLGLPSVAEADK